MITQQEHIHSFPSDTPPASPGGIKQTNTPITDSCRIGIVPNEPRVTIICSCGRRISVSEHEVRTAMTAILGFGGLLADELSEPDQAYAAEAICSNGQRLLQLLCGVRVPSPTDI